MISRAEAEEIAAEWARRESARLGYECTPKLSEFDVGYVVWSAPPADVRTVPGDGATTVIDKETGEVSSWPGLPPAVVQDLYREQRANRPPAVRTVEPAAVLRRTTSRGATPGTAAHLTVRGDLHIAQGAKGDVEIRHHRLVREYLYGLAPGHLVRGGDRHAELIAVSDVLHEHDRRRGGAGEPLLTLEDARRLFGGSLFELFRVREPGDPAGGPADLPCESCLAALVHFGVLPWPELGSIVEWRPEPRPVPDPGRFPAEVGFALAAGGWEPVFGAEWLATHFVAEVCEVAGQRHRHESFPAVVQALTSFPGLACRRSGPGEQVWIRRFQIEPGAVAHTADTLGDFGALIGVRLFPIGTENGDSILAIDEHGRVFALDQAGEWFLGGDIDAALTTLVLGRAPARVRDDGTW